MTIEDEIINLAENYKKDMVSFLQDLIKIPSISGKEEKLALRVKMEMDKLGFHEVYIDKLGNVIGRIGKGKNIIAFDAHMDTADIGDRDLWCKDPLNGDIFDGIIYGRGAADQKGGLAAMIYGGKIINELGIFEDFMLYFTATVMKEECEGMAWQYIIKEDNIKPDFVVVTEPTNLKINIGNRGRAQLVIKVKGLPCYAGTPERGINPIYKVASIIKELEMTNKCFAYNGFLGKDSLAVTKIVTNSNCSSSTPDECRIYVDIRTNLKEKIEDVIEEVQQLPSAFNSDIELFNEDKPSYTGMVYPFFKFTPPWLIEKDNLLLKAAEDVFVNLFNKTPKIDKWNMSTIGSVTAGIHSIPTIGFGPGNEKFVHGPREQVEIEQLISASEFYAMLPAALKKKIL